MKRIIAALLICTVFTVPMVIGQQRGIAGERLTVVPFVNSTDVRQWDNLAQAMTDSISLTLRLSGQFRIVQSPPGGEIDPYSPDGPLQLSRLVRELRLDAAIIGRITPLENDRVELEAAVYSRQSGTIIGAATREAFGAFDILDAADELVAVASSAFLGYNVQFGAIVLKPSRSDVPFKVMVDGIDVGRNVSSLPQILTGRRTIEIAVITSRGEQYVYSADRLIRPGEAIEVNFGLPAVTTEEQRRIDASHGIAEDLLGRPDRFQVAFEALAESSALLEDAMPDTVVRLKERQARLETLWRLEEEFHRIDPGTFAREGSYVPGEALQLLRTSGDMIARNAPFLGDDGVRSRIMRNGLAVYHLLHIARSAAFGEGDWERAAAILTDMEEVVSRYGLENSVQIDDEIQTWQRAQGDAEGYGRRSRRPWPYIGFVAGAGGVGFGGYMWAVDVIGGYNDQGDDYMAKADAAATQEEEDSYRDDARDEYDKADMAEIVQFTSLIGGGVLAVLSAWRIIHNRRADDRFLTEWATGRYGQEVTLAERIFSRRFQEAVAGGIEGNDLDVAETQVLVVGPSGTVAHVDGQPRVIPFIVDVDSGKTLGIDRPPVVDADRTRVYEGPYALLVLQ